MTKIKNFNVSTTQPITFEKYNQIFEYSKKMGNFYLQKSRRSENEVKKKLASENVPEGVYKFYNNLGNIEEVDFIEDSIKFFKDENLIDDKALDVKIVREHITKGYGSSTIKASLERRGLKYVPLSEKDVKEAAKNAIKNIKKSPEYKKISPHDEDALIQKIRKELLIRGFTNSDIDILTS